MTLPFVLILSLTLFGILFGAVSYDNSAAENSIPVHLQHWPGLYIRIGNTIEDAPEEDVIVALRYPLYEDKGKLIDGQRITIMTSTDTAAVGEEIRIIHVMEATEPGVEVYVMGPKYVYGEYIDGVLMTEPEPGWDNTFIPEIYDGAVLQSPAVDYNYDITSYTFDEPGTHRIQWILYPWKSNVLTVEVRGG